MAEVLKGRDSTLITDGSVVGIYDRECACLSNFSAYQVELGGEIWATSEHLYHACKFSQPGNEHIVGLIKSARSADAAFKIARHFKDQVDPEWEKIRVPLMYEICKIKLSQHPYVAEKLRQTGDLEIVEDTARDGFWGMGPDGNGENHLGKIWMRLRNELKLGEISVISSEDYYGLK